MNINKIKNLTRPLLRALFSVGPFRALVRLLVRMKFVPRVLWRSFPVEARFKVSFGRRSFLYASSAYDSIGRILYWGGEGLWESESTFLFSRLAEKGGLMLDIGANTGIYSLITLAANDANTVIAFEPIPSIRERLQLNLDINHWGARCLVRYEAVSSKAGHARFHVPDRDMPTTGSLNTEGFQGVSGSLMDIELVTIDQVVPPEQAVSLVKMDIEGFEDQALAGMQRILEQDKPVIMLECNPGGPAESITRKLQPLGYRFFHMHRHGLVPVEGIQPDQTGHFRNFLCISAKKTSIVDRFLVPGKHVT